jgi:C-terminal processing protease CtpA/Prc
MNLFRTGALAFVALVSLGLAAWAQNRDNPDTPKDPPPAKAPPPALIPETPGPAQPAKPSPAQPGQDTAQHRGFLGVVANPDSRNGIDVLDVIPNSPAARVGLQRGDRIIKISNQQVNDVNQFIQAVMAHKPGDKITVDVMRGGKEQSLAATVGERPANMGFGLQPMPNQQFPNYPQQTGFPRAAFIGVQAQPLTPELKEKLKVNADTGIVITEVVPNTPAAQAGLNRDDVITAINDQPIKTPDDLRNAIQSAGSGKEITLQVLRGSKTVSLKATPRDGASGMMPAQGFERIPSTNLGYGQDQSQVIRDLERRVAELEKKIQQLEKK